MCVAQWVHCNSAKSRSVRTPAHTFLRPHPALQRPVPVVRLTAKERILIHLADYAKYADVVEVTPEMGQEGIARAAGIYVQHVRQFLDPLLKEGLARERTAHVKGHRRRLRVYDLTDAGRLAASRLREEMRDERVRVRDAAGVRDATIGDILRETKGRVPFGRLVRAALQGETLDLAPAEAGPPSGFVERLAEVPRLQAFVGRRAELDVLTAPGSGPRVFVVRGVPGIGKSSLAAKACERLRGTRNLFWHRIRPWDTREAILADLGTFLTQLGRPGLASVLSRGETDRADQVVREDLSGTNSFLVFDEVHEALPEALAFLRFLKDAVAAAADVRVLLLTRQTLPIYDRRDVAVAGLVREIDLTGLDSNEIGEMLAADADAPALRPLADRLGGHPLFLELLRSAGRSDMRSAALHDVRRFIEEEVYSRLSDAERTMMKVASLYEVPVPRDALLVDPRASHDVLISLQNRALLTRLGDDAYGAHEVIRDFFASVLTPAERRALAPFAVEQLHRKAEQHRETGDAVACVHALSNAFRLAGDEAVRAMLAESLGDADERIGDLPSTLIAYKTALKLVTEPETRARLHRKVAMALQARGETTTVLGEIEQGLQALGGRWSVEAAWLDLVRARVALRLEEWTEAREHADRAIQTFRAFDDAYGMGQALLARGQIEVDADGGRPEEAERYLEDSLRFAPVAGGEAFTARAHLEMARNLAFRLVDPAGAFRHVEAAESLVADSRDPHIERSLRMLQGWMELDFRGDYAAAGKHFREAIEIARRTHAAQTIAFARFALAHNAFFEGRADEARRELADIADEIGRLGYANYVVECWWMIAQCSMWDDDRLGFQDAMARLRRPELQRALESRPFHAGVVTGIERLLRGDRDGSLAAFRDAVRASEESFRFDETSPVFFTEFFLGVALGAVGRDDEAVEHIRKSEAFLRSRRLEGRLPVIPEAYRRFTAFLRQASGRRG